MLRNKMSKLFLIATLSLSIVFGSGLVATHLGVGGTPIVHACTPPTSGGGC